jgi:hypothetical protein
MLHKNTVQYRIRKAQESLGRPVGGNRHGVELALRASRWLGAPVLQPVAGGQTGIARPDRDRDRSGAACCWRGSPAPAPPYSSAVRPMSWMDSRIAGGSS